MQQPTANTQQPTFKTHQPTINTKQSHMGIGVAKDCAQKTTNSCTKHMFSKNP
jgi:hypothetical protein